jgi:uncharacterized protein (TIGR02145 family)
MKRITLTAIVALIACSDDNDDNTYIFTPIPGVEYGSLEYEGYTYRTVVIGEQTWMAENLRYSATGSKCYGEGMGEFIGEDIETGELLFTALPDSKVQANCELYGRLYDWVTTMALEPICSGDDECNDILESKHRGICPEGWHVPDEAEWWKLSNFAETPFYSDGGKHLKARAGWDCKKGDGGCRDNNGEDTYGFSALPGGYSFYLRDSLYAFVEAGKRGYFWIGYSENPPYFPGSKPRFYIAEFDDISINIRPMRYKSDFISLRCIKD